MRAKIKVGGKEFHLLSILTGVEERSMGLCNIFNIKITNDSNISREFDFYDSMANYEANKEDLTEEDLKIAFRWIIDDGIAGSLNFEDFCSEGGYNTDSREAERTYKLCEESLEKLNDLGILENELSNIIEELSEQGVGD